jgi:cyclase
MYKRIIGLVLIDGGVVCRTRNFSQDYHYIDTHIDTKFFDEICFIDVTKEKNHASRSAFLRTLESLMVESQLPISIGGSIGSLEDIRRYRAFGADRYLINQSSSESDDLVSECINEFGRSTIISSINHWGKDVVTNGVPTPVGVRERIKQINGNFGSELLLNSVERDGTLTGMDEQTVKHLSDSGAPSLIISGGLGRFEHALEMLSIESVSAVCTSNIYHLTTQTICAWRKRIRHLGGNVREV